MSRKAKLSSIAAVLGALLLVLSMTPAGAGSGPGEYSARLTCTADAQGYCVVNHPAGVVPDAVLVTPEVPAIVSVDQLTTKTFRLRFARAVASNGSVTPLTGVRAFYVHVDWTPGVTPSPSPAPTSASWDPTHFGTFVINLVDPNVSAVTVRDNLLYGGDNYVIVTKWTSGPDWVLTDNRVVNATWGGRTPTPARAPAPTSSGRVTRS